MADEDRPRSGSIPPISDFVGRGALKLAEENNVRLNNGKQWGDTTVGGGNIDQISKLIS